MNELNDDDVVAMDESLSFADQPMSKYGDVVKSIRNVLGNTLYGDKKKAWLINGVECEVLRIGGAWQKGRMRLRLEFIPDSEAPGDSLLSESPLDDLRAELLDS